MKILIFLTIISIILSCAKNKDKTFKGIKKGFKMFLGILPEIVVVLGAVSVFLYVIPDKTLVRWLGRDSGFTGMLIAALIGSISLIPGFISYPLAALLLQNGVSYAVISVFITTLMMVGVMTLPIESKYFGYKVSILRNVLSFAGALIIGLMMAIIL